MSSVAILAGLGIATAGILGRLAVRYGKQMSSRLKNQLDAIPGGTFSKYYQGGFEKKMTRREAFLILGLNANASKERIRLAHKRIREPLDKKNKFFWNLLTGHCEEFSLVISSMPSSTLCFSLINLQ
ncbi:Mitochondrial import inner membrane translocase subunit [Trichinella spiralis]|uniref:Mitochondrial import inner membrane translocase subunit n=1 Tax=Trichinella spiralis TaxID=6334 RepID=A0ABR3KH09_TRISP